MSRDPRLDAVPLFAGLADDEIALLASQATLVSLESGAELFAEGDSGDGAYVITAGELEIVKQGVNREVLLAVQGPGSVIGEMALLTEEPRMAAARARSATEVLRIPKLTFDELLDTSPTAARRTIDIVIERWRENQGQLQQSERMAQLGTLTAGLAHELNNPAAAVSRSAANMRDAFVAYGAAVGEASRAVDADTIGDLEALIAEVLDGSGRPVAMDPLARSDLEADIEDWLMDRAIERAWELAPALADLGWGNDDLERIGDRFGASVAPVIGAITAAASAGTLLREIEEGAGRLSAIVKALKSYTYLDQAPVQVVDLVRGLEDTLLILGHKIKGIRILREYADDLPTIEAYGSELNQVWTNLIDNAADAIDQGAAGDGSSEGGIITIRAFPSERGVVVEIEDNGPGIPDELQRRVFDSFFTTKPPGSGTGLGLDISRSIVMMRHGGSIDVTSVPGSTVFRVELPLRPPA